MTRSQLYSLYSTGHAEAWRVTDGGVLRPFEVSVHGAGLADAERLVLELALHDATNGTPPRSRHAFDRAIDQAAWLMASLGLRIDAEDACPARARDEAA